jgi:hypothetical protein
MSQIALACIALLPGDYQNNDIAHFAYKSFQKNEKLSKKARSFSKDKIKLDASRYHKNALLQL